MARIRQIEIDEASPESAGEWRKQIEAHGRMTNMKRTLAHSWPAFRALMEWYPLRDAVAEFLGDRLTYIFAHAISVQADCLICSTFFRRLLIDSGENPDAFALDAWAQTVVEYGRQLVRDAHAVSDTLYHSLAERLTEEQIVTLTAFGCMMLATNVFNDALCVDLDEYLEPYRAPRGAHA